MPAGDEFDPKLNPPPPQEQREELRAVEPSPEPPAAPVDRLSRDDDIPFDAHQIDEHDRWDADDPRRQKDQMAPPAEPCECYCLHCQRTFMSDQIWLQKMVGDPSGFEGFWMCPTPNCDGAGFTFDIFPTDPAHPANGGWTWFDDDEYDEDDEYESEWDPEIDAANDPPGDYDPDETKYKNLDEQLGDAGNDIIEGDEWKLGLAPGEAVPPQAYWSENARREWEEEQKRYDGPDERPREIQWTQRDFPRGPDGGSQFKDDDIPF